MTERDVLATARTRDGMDGQRLLARLDQLAAIGATPTGGVTRPAWGPDDLAARDLVARWMGEAGLEPTVDAATNLVGRRPGRRDRWIASGSHLDTVVDAGHLDGAYGVLAAIEVASHLRDADEALEHGLLVVAFANEEGARGTDGMTGSHACIGRSAATPMDGIDDEGLAVADRVRAAGGDPDAVDRSRWDLDRIDAFVELHIEQGPVLDVAQVPIGVVTGITGRQAIELHVRGAANHAGTTPMDLRHDALAAAAEIILAVEALPGPGGVRVATTGHLVVAPNVRNVIPGDVVVGIEVRDLDEPAIDAAVGRLLAVVGDVADRRHVIVDAVLGQRVPPQACAPLVVDSIRHAAGSLGLSPLDLPSGAGHDAQVIGQAVPMGMIFVPSIGGISHSPDERTAPEHLVLGAEVLRRSLLDLDRRIT